MKITRRQLRRIIREAEGSTKKYDDDSALKGGQSKLPDGLQKGIIDKTVEDREEREEEEREEKNEATRLARHQLRNIIREALDSYGRLDTHNMSANEAAEFMAVLQEFGYSLFVSPSVSSNATAINDALMAYPGEFTYDELMTAISIAQGRGV